MSDETNKVLLAEKRRLAAQPAGQAAREKQGRRRSKAAPVAPTAASELAGVAHALHKKAVYEAVAAERAFGRNRTAARISQIVDYAFYLIYGVITLQFLLKLMGAPANHEFVQFVVSLSVPLLAALERKIGTVSVGAIQIQFSYLFALIVYTVLHLALNTMLRFIAHRKGAI